jgi:hypothetical protein
MPSFEGDLMLYYLPLEPYEQRYTMQLSAKDTGWMERNWKKAEVNYIRIEGKHNPDVIETGVVLDAVGRSRWAMSQISNLLIQARAGNIKDSDVIYFEDFWHPGIEALPYYFQQRGIRPRMYAYCWAQSVDMFDFTYPMRHWMRHFEKGISEILDGIFVACPTLKDELILQGVAPYEKVHVVGLPFDSEEVKSRMPEWYQQFSSGTANSRIMEGKQREDTIIFSSRFDAEKDPMFFLKVALNYLEGYEESDTVFKICTSAPKLTSNHPEACSALRTLVAKYPNNIKVLEGLSKEEYYAELCKAKIQFNCADQDWVSFTLLEASTAGCYPIYPYFRSFPETLHFHHQYLYQKHDIRDAVEKIDHVLGQSDLWTSEKIKERSWIHTRYDWTWLRMLKHMGVEHRVEMGGREYRVATESPYLRRHL